VRQGDTSESLAALSSDRVMLDHINPLPPSDAVREQRTYFRGEKFILEDLFCSVLSKFEKKITPLET